MHLNNFIHGSNLIYLAHAVLYKLEVKELTHESAKVSVESCELMLLLRIQFLDYLRLFKSSRFIITPAI